MTNKNNPVTTDSDLISTLSNSDIDLFLTNCFKAKTGRPSKLSFFALLHCLDLKRRYSCDSWLGLYLCLQDNTDLNLPDYSNFLKSVKRLTVFLYTLICYQVNLNRQSFINQNIRIALVDSTPLPVCKLPRSSRHKTMKEYASYSKSTMGWYYGLKLHLVSDWETAEVIDFKFSHSNFDDRQYLKDIINDKDKFFASQTLFVGDKGYQAKWLEVLAQETGNYLITGKKRSKNTNTLASTFDIYLLHTRARVETIFSNLKQNCFLTHTRSRSVLGYMFNYISAMYFQVFKRKIGDRRSFAI
jgi:hypothetical protein